jgi:SAM-dependent methyltransferase
VIFLAEQLRGKNAEVIALDLSQNSLEVAKKRAEIRKLSNIKWYNESLLDLPKLDMGKFDYINCSGVLHHLEDPSNGLLALKSVLKEDGAMGIMLYGKYGRNGVYETQEVMRLVNKNERNIESKLSNCRVVLNSLIINNSLRLNEIFLNEIHNFGDSGIFDLLLHSKDKPFTVPEIYELIESNNLEFITFIGPFGTGKKMYNPLPYIKDEVLAEKTQQLSLREQQTIAELLSFNIHKHQFYISKKKKTIPKIDDLSNVPFYSASFAIENIYKKMYEAICSNLNDPLLTMNYTLNKDTKFTVQIKRTRFLKDIFYYLNGVRTLDEIFDLIIKEHKEESNLSVTKEELLESFKEVYSILGEYDIMLLRSNIAPPPLLPIEMQNRLIALYS